MLPCKNQPPDRLVDERERGRLESDRFNEVALAIQRQEVYFLHRNSPDLAEQLADIDERLRRSYERLADYYDYPDGYEEGLGTTDPVDVPGRYYDGFWGDGYEDCP